MTAVGAAPAGALLRWLGAGRHSTARAVPELWRASWRVGPVLTGTVLTLTLLLGLAGPVQFVAMGAVVGGLTADGAGLWPAVTFLIVVAAARTVLPVVVEPLTGELVRRIDLNFRNRMVACLTGPYGVAHLEDSGTRDLISTAQGIASPGQGPGSGARGYLNLIALKAGAFGSILLLAQYRWWLGLGVAAGAMVIRRHILAIWFQTAQALSGDVPGLRRSEYLRDLALRPETAKETRLFGLGGWLVGRHDTAWTTAMAPVWRRRRSIGWRMTVVDLAVLVLAALAGVPIVLGLVSGDLDAAQAVVLGGALTAIVGLGGFLPDADFPIRYGCLTLPSLLELEARMTARRNADAPAGTLPTVDGGRSGAAPPEPAPPEPAPPAGPLGDIRFDRVGFHYPGVDRPVVDGVDLTIADGSTVALVGANGAGKTTIIKLLTRLYEPTSGSIRVGDTDLRDLDPERWRRRLAVIFQDFARYELSARDNVGFGALDLLDDRTALEEAADRAGVLAAIRGMPRGWDSPLSRNYSGGADLSGGQWQRIALARALLAVRAGARVLVLDEPTANLDVRAEAEFYDRFLDLTSGTTTVLVSHRFSTVRRADRICVLDGGRVTEDGSHDELISLGGTYARMFRLQAERFVDG
ncbi:ABC transporter ATP-binding protein [Plantactinospora sp. BC1]|uniref:ABC transporter ATP-binding protein n=1 Tax=Plantactinospora sp. BC1 TaxID=2108470 RepID=UPI00131EDA0D|nr:ABC transporter ATP-binding protein [Plantactinospora sp. BC1]